MSEKMKILVVDDERLNINVLVELLKPNYKMMAAINGQQAIKVADYLPKPISPAIVEARVRTQLALKKNHEELKDAYRLIETQKKRMQTELDVGRDIQLAMVPKIFPSNAVFDIHARLELAREVGGDFYDVFSIDEEHNSVYFA
jgi:response regulator RpfG family c-di-GMP phosphodiesterase